MLIRAHTAAKNEVSLLARYKQKDPDVPLSPMFLYHTIISQDTTCLQYTGYRQRLVTLARRLPPIKAPRAINSVVDYMLEMEYDRVGCARSGGKRKWKCVATRWWSERTASGPRCTAGNCMVSQFWEKIRSAIGHPFSCHIGASNSQFFKDSLRNRFEEQASPLPRACCRLCFGDV